MSQVDQCLIRAGIGTGAEQQVSVTSHRPIDGYLSTVSDPSLPPSPMVNSYDILTSQGKKRLQQLEM